jgi:hypothetical protein
VDVVVVDAAVAVVAVDAVVVVGETVKTIF